MSDIIERLDRYAFHAECPFDKEAFELAADEITRLRNDLRNAIFSERDYVKEIERQDVLLREENVRLREALTLFAAKEPVQLTYEGRAFIKAIIVSESELAAARAVIREGEKGDGKNN